jgi:hypothetical protein
MSEVGQKRRFERASTTSGLPLETDILRAGLHVSKVPIVLKKYTGNFVGRTSPRRSLSIWFVLGAP